MTLGYDQHNGGRNTKILVPVKEYAFRLTWMRLNLKVGGKNRKMKIIKFSIFFKNNFDFPLITDFVQMYKNEVLNGIENEALTELCKS